MDIAWTKGVEPEVVQRLRSQGKSTNSLKKDSVRQCDRATTSGGVPEVSASILEVEVSHCCSNMLR